MTRKKDLGVQTFANGSARDVRECCIGFSEDFVLDCLPIANIWTVRIQICLRQPSSGRKPRRASLLKNDRRSKLLRGTKMALHRSRPNIGRSKALSRVSASFARIALTRRRRGSDREERVRGLSTAAVTLNVCQSRNFARILRFRLAICALRPTRATDSHVRVHSLNNVPYPAWNLESRCV